MTNTPDKSEMKADPERIWLQPRCCASEYEGRLWCEDKVFDDCEDGNEPTEYVRADLIQQQQATIERLSAVLDGIISETGDRGDGLIDWQRCVDRIQDRARAALWRDASDDRSQREGRGQ